MPSITLHFTFVPGQFGRIGGEHSDEIQNHALKFGADVGFHVGFHDESSPLKYPACVAIVDDDQQLLVSISGLLRSFGIKALLFQSAEDFFQAWPAPVDCIIADVHMPGMNGLAMLEKLRERDSRVPVIVVSALDPETTRAEALALGANAYFSKPVNSDDLMECMVRVVNARDGMNGN